MKTTLELPDSLFREAKTTAARMGTTLKALMTEALEARLHGKPPTDSRSSFRLKTLPRRPEPRVTNEKVARLDLESEKE